LKENAPTYLNFIQKIAGYSDFDLTWSAIDTCKFNQFKNWINNLCNRLIGCLKDDNEAIKQKVIEARQELNNVSIGVDLYKFCEVLKEKVNDNDLKHDCQVIMNSINWDVLISKFHQNEGRTNGLSIFFPYNIHNYSKNNITNTFDQTYRWVNDSINEPFKLSFAIDTLWDEFLIEIGKDE
jgi:hypothetical protein